MTTRSRTTFQKRQKELARQERQRAKVARRMERKLQKQAGVTEPDTPLEGDEVLEEGVEEGSEEAKGPEGQPAEDATCAFEHVEAPAPAAGGDERTGNKSGFL